ncbi:MAG: hypothetical protein ACFE9Q_06260 [Candidatus Hodarchaeota archaeon]
MFNKKFKENWLKILSFNKNRDILEDPEKAKELVRIPLSPIELDANILFHFFSLLYPKFINDQQNILDIIITETDKKNKILGLYLYKTKKAGIHETVESLPEDLFRIKSFEIEKFEDIFSKAQTVIMKEKGIQISSIRLFKKEAIDIVNKHCEKVEEISLYEFLSRIMDLIQKIFEKDLFLIYPEPLVFEFFRRAIKLLNKMRLQNVYKFIEALLPEFNISLLIGLNNTKIILLLQKTVLKSGKSELLLKFFTLQELGIKPDELKIKLNLNSIQQKLKTERAYNLNQNDIVSFILDFFEFLLPITKEKFKFLLQKALFIYRDFENHWDMVPRPVIYNNLVRFLVRLFGFNLNLKKISHWAIPELIFNYIDFYFGLNSKILIIITDLRRTKLIRGSQDKLLKNTCKHTLILEFEECTLKKMSLINKEELFSASNSNSFSSIRNVISEKFGTISSIMTIDMFLLKNIIKNFIFNHSKLSFFPRFKTLKLLRNENYFRIFPEVPFYKLIKSKKLISQFKLLLPILIDRFEF